MLNDRDMDAMHNRVSTMMRNQVRSMWPLFLIYFCVVSSTIGGFIWLLLYILETYVGKA